MTCYVVGLMEHERSVYSSYLLPYLSTRGRVLEVIAASSHDSLAKQYNRGIASALFSEGPIIDVIVFIHPDVIILDSAFESRVEDVFRNDPGVAICGVIGSSELPANGNWWSSSETSLRGEIVQEHEGDRPTREVFGSTGYFDDLLVVDGLCLAVNASVCREGLRFDETLPNYLHTDTDLCFSALRRGYKIAVVDLLLQHRSEGRRADSNEWTAARDLVFRKWGVVRHSDVAITKSELLDAGFTFRKEGK